MDVKRFRLSHGLTVKDVVSAMRPEYPGYSKVSHCMVENPARYGVKLLPEAEDILRGRAGVRTGDRHRNRYRLSCRVTEARYEAVKRAVEAEGRFPTIQAWLDWWTYVWLKGKKRAAASGNDTDSGSKENNSIDRITPESEDVNGLERA